LNQHFQFWVVLGQQADHYVALLLESSHLLGSFYQFGGLFLQLGLDMSIMASQEFYFLVGAFQTGVQIISAFPGLG
jgi:hypothetical protein